MAAAGRLQPDHDRHDEREHHEPDGDTRHQTASQVWRANPANSYVLRLGAGAPGVPVALEALHQRRQQLADPFVGTTGLACDAGCQQHLVIGQGAVEAQQATLVEPHQHRQVERAHRRAIGAGSRQPLRLGSQLRAAQTPGR